MTKVLVLGREVRSFLTVVRSLGRRRVAVHVGWCPPESPALHSKYVVAAHNIPAYSPRSSAWEQALVSVMRQENFDLVIPTDDSTLIPLQCRRTNLETFGAIYLLDDPVFAVVFDKLKSHELAKSLRIPTPQSVVVSDPSQITRALAEFAFPLVVKPRSSFTPHDVINRNRPCKVHDVEQLTAYLQTACSDAVLLQEYFVGKGVGVELLVDGGDVLVAFQHERIHEPLTGGGSSYRRSVPLKPELRNAAEKLMRALRYTGVAMVEFRMNFKTGKWVFLEINGRFWGSLPLAVAAGVDFPYYLYQLLVEKRRAFPQHYATNLYSRNLSMDAAWMLENFKADKSDPTLTRLSVWRVAKEVINVITLRERSDVFVLDDPKPGFVELVQLIITLWTRVMRELRDSLLALPPVRRIRMRSAERVISRARRVLFVCKGNICRSPFAQYYARAILPPAVEVYSCGYYPVEGRVCPQTALAAAKEMGIELAEHRSKIISQELLTQADLVLAFDESDYATLRNKYPSVRGKMYLLGIFAPRGGITIRDPYGGSIDDFRTVYRKITRALDSLKSLVIGCQNSTS